MINYEKKIRLANKNDSKRIWEIRNDFSIRKKSKNSKIILFIEHDKWFNDKYFLKDDNFCYVLVINDKVEGYCRLDSFDKNCYYISIAISHDFQGKGLGNYFLKEILKNYKDKIEIIAEIKKSNISSQKFFENNDFIFFKEDKNYLYYKFKI